MVNHNALEMALEHPKLIIYRGEEVKEDEKNPFHAASSTALTPINHLHFSHKDSCS